MTFEELVPHLICCSRLQVNGSYTWGRGGRGDLYILWPRSRHFVCILQVEANVLHMMSLLVPSFSKQYRYLYIDLHGS